MLDINGSIIEQNGTTPLPMLDCDLPLGECDIVRTLKKVVLSIAIILQLVTIICIFILRKYRLFHQRIICHILVANLLEDIVLISNGAYPGSEGTSACIAQGFFTQVFGFGQFSWIFILTIFLFLHLIKSTDTARFEWLYTTVAWTLSVSLACLPLTTGDYGIASAPFCWITKTTSGHAWRFTIYWVPVYGGLLVVLILFIYMIWHATRAIKLYKGGNDALESKHKYVVREYLKPLTGYAASFVLINFIQFINRIQNVKNFPILGLLATAMFFYWAYGIVLCTLFVITNGRQSFTLNQFRDGIAYHSKFFRHCKSPDVINEYEVEVGNPSAVTTPDLPRKSRTGDNRPSLCLTDAESAEDSGFEPGDIRSFDATRLDTISLDSA